ncbi:hypothetical protein [Actinoplanes sp. NPDC049118]|uniref:hypothetical protein n=1 Tax=Actinoplanes sp. NPDC049118 TaxID=3155769 RepID=UPI0033E00665
MRVLTGHTSPETAYEVDDYPYGFRLRCRIRYWVETATKGAKKGRQRFMSQTTNPKVDGEPWNKPKGSTYDLMTFMYLDDQDHVHHFGVSEYGVTPESDARLRLRGIYEQMTDEQRTFYDTLVKLSRKYAEPWEHFGQIVAAMGEHIWATDKDPEPVNGIWEWPGGRAHVGYDLAVYVTTARNLIGTSRKHNP